MIIEVLAIFVIFILVKYVFLPWRKTNYYAASLRNMGYRVYKYPFDPIGFQFIRTFDQDYKKHGDGLYTSKHVLTKYDVTVSNFFDKVAIEVLSPQLLKEFYSQDKVYVYQKYKQSIAFAVKIFGTGVLFGDGPMWKRSRKCLNQVFNFDLIVKLIPSLNQSAMKSIQAIKQKFNSNQRSLILDIKPYCLKMSASVSELLFFGPQNQQISQRIQKLSELILHIVQSSIQMTLKAPQLVLLGTSLRKLKYRKEFRQFQNNCKKCFSEIDQLIKICSSNKRQRKDRQSISILQHIQLWNQKAEENQKFSSQDIRNQFMSIHIAATDTSTYLMLGMLYSLDLYPQVCQKIIQQAQEIIKDKSQYLKIDKLKQFKYFDCFQKQAIRMFNPVNRLLIREVVADHKLKDVPIYKGSKVFASNLPNSFNQKNFENPFQFKPERWLNGDLQSKLEPYSYVGFSAGPRTCLGKQLALFQNKIFILKFIQEFKLQLLDKNVKFEALTTYYMSVQPVKLSMRTR